MSKLKRIHSDARGELYTLMLGNREYLLMKTLAGFSRGGDYHKSVQHDVVLSGAVKFVWREEGNDKSRVLREGDSIIFLPKMPHLMKAISDSDVLEWLEGPFEKEYYEPYRKGIK